MNKESRIVSIDFLRFLATVLMIEGHTVHVFLDSGLRNSNYLLYDFWVWMRGFTAPLFMFTSGLIFTYLLFNSDLTLNKNRFNKGLKRGVFLLSLGYLLRFPSLNPFRIMNISESQIKTFASVDALHIIGIGLILIAFFSKFLVNKIPSRFLSFAFFSLVFISLLVGIFIDENKIGIRMPLFISAYFTDKFGSVFTLFPWLGYMFFGSSFSFLIKMKKFNAKNIFISSIVFYLVYSFYGMKFGVSIYQLFIERSAFVLILFSVSKIFFENNSSIPKIFLSVARNTLPIYVIHLVILYGSPISLGFYQIIPGKFSLLQTIIAVLLMELIMFYIAMLLENYSAKLNKVALDKSYAEIK